MKWKTRKTRTRKTIVDNLVHNRESPLDFFGNEELPVTVYLLISVS